MVKFRELYPKIHNTVHLSKAMELHSRKGELNVCKFKVNNVGGQESPGWEADHDKSLFITCVCNNLTKGRIDADISNFGNEWRLEKQKELYI